ncbi:hypothetical protein NYZ99_11655 [Maribacter litopenaei]|uniref:Uncharacterized protein n=1 Tax=Maribacter litopenaei TaxID=2976127 RepID=A0ABY5Y6K8_9FLAO|nr:hypothetical protein [Maribacter litopenaei]UWX53795.1 hypothetical protein NYZ99_11655 [Maribacter litopenaei]
MQCESNDEPAFSSEFYVQNNSSVDLIWLNADAEEITVESQSEQFLGVSTNLDSFIPPSKTTAFDAITLYRKEETGVLTILYEQRPVVDDQWIFTTPWEYERDYLLMITDASLAP